MAAFKLSFSIKKEFKKKEVSGEILRVFATISLFNVQTQEPARRSTTSRAIVFLHFITTKYLKQDVDDNLRRMNVAYMASL